MREELNASWKWQPGFSIGYASDELLHEKWIYVQENPVRAGSLKIGRIGHIESASSEEKELQGNRVGCG